MDDNNVQNSLCINHFNETGTQWTDRGPWAFYFPLLYICVLCDEVLLPESIRQRSCQAEKPLVKLNRGFTSNCSLFRARLCWGGGNVAFEVFICVWGTLRTRLYLSVDIVLLVW